MNRPPSRRSPFLFLAVVAVFALTGVTLAACSISIETGTLPPTAAGPQISADTGGDESITPSTPVAIDPGLLSVLPRQVDSVSVIESPDGDDDARADDVLPTIASAAVGFEAADPKGSDVVSGFVVKLLPGAFNDSIFQDWRDSYDAGVCGGENEIVTHAETTVTGDTLYVGTCANGLLTYHTWLRSKAILVSLSSYGDRHLGLVLMGNLKK